MDLAELIRTAREARGWELGEAAKRCGMHKSTLSNLETGKRGGSPRIGTLKQLADGLGLTLEELEATVEKVQGKPKPKARPKGRPRVLPERRETAQERLTEPGPGKTPAAPVEAPKELLALPPIMSVEQAAGFLGVSRGTLFTAIKEGQIPSKKIGKRRVIVREALKQWLLS